MLKHSKLGYKEWMAFWFNSFFKTSRVCAFPPATFAQVSSSSSKSLQPTLLPKLLQRWRMTASLPFALQSLEMNLGANQINAVRSSTWCQDSDHQEDPWKTEEQRVPWGTIGGQEGIYIYIYWKSHKPRYNVVIVLPTLLKVPKAHKVKLATAAVPPQLCLFITPWFDIFTINPNCMPLYGGVLKWGYP